MISFDCPSCAAPIRVADTTAGKRGKCPKCNAAVSVPALTPPPLAPQIAGTAWSDEDFAEPVKKPEPTPAAIPSTLEACRDCERLISKAAITCPQCGCPLKTVPQISTLVPSLVGQLLTVIGLAGVAFFAVFYPLAMPGEDVQHSQLIGVLCSATLAIVAAAPTTIRRKWPDPPCRPPA